MKLRGWHIAVTLALVVMAANPVAAQPRALRELLARPNPADALADLYGKAVVDEFARQLAEQGDPGCRKLRKLTPAVLKRRAGELLASYGAKLVAQQSSRPSDTALAARLDELTGSGSADKLRELADDRRIRQLQQFYRARTNDNLVDRITVALDHYLTIHSLMRGATSPLSAGNMQLATIAAERAINAEEGARKAFGEDQNLQSLVDIYGVLIEVYDMELIASSTNASPDYDVFKGIEEQLKALCVRP